MAEQDRPELSWDDYFMGLAEVSARRSKDPKTQVGACIVNNNKRIVALGYNGMVSGWHDDRATLAGEDKQYYVCHAEVNALLNKNQASVADCTLYTTLYPCCHCAKYIVQAEIRKVVFLDKRDKKEYEVAEDIFRRSGVELRQLKPEQRVKLELTSAAPGSAESTLSADP